MGPGAQQYHMNYKLSKSSYACLNPYLVATSKSGITIIASQGHDLFFVFFLCRALEKATGLQTVTKENVCVATIRGSQLYLQIDLVLYTNQLYFCLWNVIVTQMLHTPN